MHQTLTKLCEEILSQGIESTEAQRLIKKVGLSEFLSDRELASEILYRLNMSTLENVLFEENMIYKGDENSPLVNESESSNPHGNREKP